MNTKFVEATQGIEGGFNHGKFLVGRFSVEEWERTSSLDAAVTEVERSLLFRCGWTTQHMMVFDLQTGEGAMFMPGGSPRADLSKRRIWVCPMFEPFLGWLYAFVASHGQTWFDDLPRVPVEIPSAPAAMYGYRREGVQT